MQAGRDALTLEEFSRWFPSVLGLEPLSPQHIEAMLVCCKAVRIASKDQECTSERAEPHEKHHARLGACGTLKTLAEATSLL